MEEASQGQSREQDPSPAEPTPPGLDWRRLTRRGLLELARMGTAGALRNSSSLSTPSKPVFYTPDLEKLEPLKDAYRKVQEAQQGRRPGGRS